MIPWGVFFARRVARCLQTDPRQTLDQAADQVKAQLAQSGIPQPLLTHIEREYHDLLRQYPSLFRRVGVLNPHYLFEKLGKQIFLYFIDGTGGRYQALRSSLQGWNIEHSRFVLFGSQDVLVILYGTSEDARKFFQWLAEGSWPVDVIPIETISWWRGYPVPKWTDFSLNLEIIQAANRLVCESYDLQDLENVRYQLEEAKILLGPSVIEDTQKTGRVRAFVGVRLGGGRFPQSLEHFEQAILASSDRNAVVSIYRCGSGSYHIVLELICEDIRELDEITERMQHPSGAAYTVETTTFIVANAEVDILPTLSLQTSSQRDPFSIDLEAQLALQDPDLVRQFRTLPRQWQLFLIHFWEEYQHARPSSLPELHQDKINNSLKKFIGGILNQSSDDLRDAFLTMALVLEETGRNAVQRLVEWIYGSDYGQAQKDLQLPNSRFRKLAMGPILKALEKASQDPRYQAIGLEIPRMVMQQLEYAHVLRNELVHQISEIDLSEFARMIRDGMLYMLNGIRWLQEQIIHREVILLNYLPSLIRAISQPSSNWPVATQEELQELKNRMEDLIPDLNRQLEELIRLTTTATARLRELGQQILQHQEEILEYIRPERQTEARNLLTTLGQAGSNVALNLLANAIWSLLAWASPNYVSTMLQKMLSMLVH